MARIPRRSPTGNGLSRQHWIEQREARSVRARGFSFVKHRRTGVGEPVRFAGRSRGTRQCDPRTSGRCARARTCDGGGTSRGPRRRSLSRGRANHRRREARHRAIRFRRFDAKEIHNPLNLFGIEAAEAAFPRAVQVAVFDTAFHSTLPPEAAIYPGPYEWYERGIRRYGFHGISHQYCAMRAAELLQTDVTKLRLITCHLGSGCSLAAIEYGKSIDTTMGFTPLDGLMMGTRSGSIDPGIIFHLLRQGTYSVEELENVLNHSSGLLGVSGVSNDMRRVLHAAHHGNARAEMAIAAYVHRVRGQIGAMMAALGGFAALVFTGGVGENSPEIRARICDRLRSAGIEVDAERNESLHGDGEISASGRAWRVLVVRAREEWAVARETAAAECGKSPHSTNDLHN